MERPANTTGVWRFGVFEVDGSGGELRRGGRPVKMREQSFRILVFLLENAGEIVTREELRRVLWPSDTFVDFDHSLNTAVMKLRDALGDSADTPLYIETIPKRGYRFIAPVSPAADRNGMAAPNGDAISSGAVVTTEPSRTPLPPFEAPAPARRLPRRTAILLAGALAVVAVLLIAWWRMQPGVPSIESVTQLSDDGEPKTGSLETDGSRIYFNEGEVGNLKVAEVSVAGGATAGIDSGIGDPTMAGLMPGGSNLLVLAGGRVVFSYPLWSISLPTGEPRRLGALEGQDANFFPDGRLLIANGRELEVAERDGSNPRSLLFMAGNVMLEEPSVSPDGKRIAFTSYSRAWSTSELFESAADGKGTHLILSVGNGAQPCCVAWSPDGKYLLYTTTNPGSSGLWGGGSDLWALPMQSGFFHRSGNPYPGRPIRLTAGPLSYSGAVVSRDGKQIYAIGTKRRSELVRYDMKSHQFLPFLDGISALDPTFSKDGKWVAYTAYPEHTLWRSRSDGTDRLQLTYPPMAVAAPSLSPDGRQIAFRNSGRDLFVISMNGGPAKEIARHADAPSWSPDGNRLVFTCFTETMDDSSRWYIQIFDFRTGKTSIVPSSKGRIGGVWISQDELVAAPVLSTKFLIFDLKTQAWTDLTTGSFVNWTVSPDGKYLYFTNQGADLEVQRLRFADRQIETITSLKELRSAFDDLEGTWLNVAPDGSPVLARDLGTQEIYSLNVRWQR